MTHAAIVVSFNRRDLLRECLSSLCGQTRPLDEIIVVDNGSTDGAPDMVVAEFPQVTLYRSEKNLGGAGGFAWGVEIAIQRGHDTAWLMDDDANPEADAFAELIVAFEKNEDEVAFAASLVSVRRGEPSARPEFSTDPAEYAWAWDRGYVAVDAAMFVGALINLKIAQRTHLPLSDFFIWFDDAEYTNRLRLFGHGILVPKSQIKHPNKSPKVTPIGSRLYYLTRNSIWWRREANQSKGRVLGALVEGAVATAHQLRLPGNKLTVLARYFRGAWDGTLKSPRHVLPGQLYKNDRAVVLVHEGDRG